MKNTPIQLKYDQWLQIANLIDIALEQMIADVQDEKDLNLKLVSFGLAEVKERIDVALAKIGRAKFTINLKPSQALALYLCYKLLYLQTDDKYIDTLIKSNIIFVLDKSVG